MGLDPRTAKFQLTPVAWETAHPGNFVMVGLNGTFDSNELTGTVVGAGCRTFAVERDRARPPQGAASQGAAPPARTPAAAPTPARTPAQATAARAVTAAPSVACSRAVTCGASEPHD